MITQGCLAFRSHGSYWGIVRICKSVQNSAITFPDKDEMDFDNLATSFFCMLRNINPNIKKVEFGNQNFPHFWLREWNLEFWLPARATLQITAWVNKVTDEEHSRRLIGLNLVNLENLQNVATGKTGTVISFWSTGNVLLMTTVTNHRQLKGGAWTWSVGLII